MAAKSASRAIYAPARTEDSSRTSSSPNRSAKRRRAFSNGSGSPQPEISSVRVAMRPPTRTDFRKTKQRRVSDGNASNLSPPVDVDSTEFTKYLRRGRRNAAGAPLSQYAGAFDSQGPRNFIRADHVQKPHGRNRPRGGRHF